VIKVDAKARIARPKSRLQLRLLRIEAVLQERAFHAVDRETRPRFGDERGRTQARAHPAVVQSYVEIIVYGCAGALNKNVRINRLRDSKQPEGLIDEMRAEVVEHACPGLRHFAPAWLDRRSEPVPVRFEQKDFLKLRHDLLDGKEVAVPPPVLENAENEPTILCGRYQRVGLLQHDRERLVDD